MFLQKRHIIFFLNINIDIDFFSTSMSVVENYMKQILRCKQNFRFVELIDVRFKIEFVNALFDVFAEFFCNIVEINLRNLKFQFFFQLQNCLQFETCSITL